MMHVKSSKPTYSLEDYGPNRELGGLRSRQSFADNITVRVNQECECGTAAELSISVKVPIPSVSSEFMRCQTASRAQTQPLDQENLEAEDNDINVCTNVKIKGFGRETRSLLHLK